MGISCGLPSSYNFVISVFHAFGHQWPCQIFYHLGNVRGLVLQMVKVVKDFGVQLGSSSLLYESQV